MVNPGEKMLILKLSTRLRAHTYIWQTSIIIMGRIPSQIYRITYFLFKVQCIFGVVVQFPNTYIQIFQYFD